MHALARRNTYEHALTPTAEIWRVIRARAEASSAPPLLLHEMANKGQSCSEIFTFPSSVLILSSSVPPVVPVRLELYNTYALKAEVSIR